MVSSTILNYLLHPVMTLLFCIAGAGFALRSAAFISWAAKSRKIFQATWQGHGVQVLKIILSSFVPFHRALRQEPVFGLIRYIFHACLFIVPLWETGHIVLLDRAVGISYRALPPGVSDIMTLIVIALGIYFGARRLLDKTLRKDSSPGDYFLLMVAVTPFATGFCYAHGIDAGSRAVADTLLTLHVASGALMILTAVFLFVRTHLSPVTCVGCAACAETCPTGTLEAVRQGDKRTFFYSHYQCICCGACQSACPEGAARLKHDIGLRYFLALFNKQPIGEKQLTQCLGCDELFIPDPQLVKLKTKIESAGMEPPRTLGLCNRCKKLETHYPAAGL